MGCDESYDDYRKPEADRIENPWADRAHEIVKFYVVCTADTDGAVPLYDAINGEVCLYVVPQSCSKEVYARLSEEFFGHRYIQRVWKDVDSATFHGFVEGMHYDEQSTAEVVGFVMQQLVVDNDEAVGIAVSGEWYVRCGYLSDAQDDRNEYERMIFLPLDAAPREVTYVHTVTVYGSDGEEDEYTQREFRACVRNTTPNNTEEAQA